MARIADGEIERLKVGVDLARLIEAEWFTLKRIGKDLACAPTQQAPRSRSPCSQAGEDTQNPQGKTRTRRDKTRRGHPGFSSATDAPGGGVKSMNGVRSVRCKRPVTTP
jgi:hypothetical protein